LEVTMSVCHRRARPVPTPPARSCPLTRG
jgi:hypothetical protein